MFGYLFAGDGTASRPAEAVVRVGGGLAAAAMLVAGATFLTVPASPALGDFYGDPGIVSGQLILPSLGYILLVVGVAITAAVLMIASTRLGAFPTWLTVIAAVLLVVTGGSVITMTLLPIWVAVVAVIAWS